MRFIGDRPAPDYFEIDGLAFNKVCESGDWTPIPEKHRPKKNCKHCYGRGYIGRLSKIGDYMACHCTGLQYNQKGKK